MTFTHLSTPNLLSFLRNRILLVSEQIAAENYGYKEKQESGMSRRSDF
jgi:hypothetical protein